jgi:hypothetical protein
MSACLACEEGNAHREDEPSPYPLQLSKYLGQGVPSMREGEWKGLGTLMPSLAPGVGFVPSPGEWCS